MYLRQLNVTTSGSRILGTPYCGLLAAQIAAETASGDNGPGILYDRASEPANAGKRLRARITTAYPTTWTLYVHENGAVESFGAPDGVHTFSYDEYADETLLGSDSFTLTVCSTAALSATAEDATFSGSASVSPRASLAAVLDDAAFSGSATVSGVSPTATLAAIADDAVFAGSASAGPGAFMQATTGDASFAGAAFVSPRTAIAAVLADAAFFGSAAGFVDDQLTAADIDPDYTVSQAREFRVWQARTFTVSRVRSHARH